MPRSPPESLPESLIAFTPQESLAFRLDEVVRQLSRTLDVRLAKFDLSRTQWRLLAYVLKHAGMTQSELARVADLERASIGQTVDVMERKQMVERRQSETDRRVWQIFPTTKAQALVMFAGLDQGKQAALGSLLEQLSANLDTRN